MTPQYVTVYQIAADQAYSSPADLVKLVPVVFGIVALACGVTLFVRKTPLHWKPLRWFFAASLCVFGLFFLCIPVPRLLRLDSEALSTFQKGSYQIAEGQVTKFDPMPYDGHKNECFSVEEKRFCYSDYGAHPGFHNTASHGGPIRSGLQVRIAFMPVSHRGNIILRLEVAREQAAPLQ
jgi:hypothetical protein